MQRLRDTSLALQLPLVAAACALFVGACVVWVATASGNYLQQRQDSSYGEALARQVAATINAPLQRGDLLSVNASLQQFIDSSLAVGVRVDDVEGLPIGEAGDTRTLAILAYHAPIRIGADTAGTVSVSLDQRSSDGERLRLLLSLLALVIALSLLAFLGTRFLAQRLTARLLALESQLQLPRSERSPGTNELDLLSQAVERIPVDMLRGHADVPPAAREFRDTNVLFVHLAALARYVNTLSETNLHRYTRRLQQLLQAAVHCYRGEMRVTRQFGLLVTFGEQHNAGSEALRAASCARLVALVVAALEERTTLSLDVAMAIGRCELGAEDNGDMYPDLYLQSSVDELRDACLAIEDFPSILVSGEVLSDSQLTTAAETGDLSTPVPVPGAESRFFELRALAPDQENLLVHQAQLISERIKPAR